LHKEQPREIGPTSVADSVFHPVNSFWGRSLIYTDNQPALVALLEVIENPALLRINSLLHEFDGS